MSEMAQDAWFYTKEGERIGPVTFADLRIKAEDGTLNPRLDLLWCQGMEEWKPAGKIEGLFEYRAPEVKESLAPAADPYKPPQEEFLKEIMANQGDWPGARRRSYLIVTFLFPFVWQLAFAAATPIISGQLGKELSTLMIKGSVFVPFVVGIYFGLARLVNLGMSRWWFLSHFVPILNLWIGYRCFACPAGYAFHKKLDGPGIALAIIYWLLILIVIGVVVLMAAVMLGGIGDAGMREQIENIMRTIKEKNAATP